MQNCVVISGACSGLGEAVRVALDRHGIPTLAIVRRDCEVGDAVPLVADLAEPHDWEAELPPLLRKFAFSRLWFLDIAALLPQVPVRADDYDAQLGEAFAVNVLAPIRIARALATVAKERAAMLDIVHVSSGAAHRPIPGWSAYCTTKAAAAMQWRAFAEEETFITARLFQPGVIATAMQQRLRDAGDPFAAPEEALRSPEEVAMALLSECGLVRRLVSP